MGKRGGGDRGRSGEGKGGEGKGGEVRGSEGRSSISVNYLVNDHQHLIDQLKREIKQE